MKVSILYLLFFQLVLMSCHRKATVARLACCARDNEAAMPAVFAGPVTNASIYQLPGKWMDQHDRQFSLDELKGKVQLVAMIYTHCGYACPRIVADMRAIEDSLPAAEKSQVDFVLVSLDPERDTPAELRQFATQKQLDNRWELLHGGADQVRELSMLLDVRYQRLADGNYTHTNAIVVLDKQGDVVRRFDGLADNARKAVSSIHPFLNQ